MEIQKQQYEEYVKQVTPTHNLWINILRAFLVGGIICTLGQVSINLFIRNGFEKDSASAWTTLLLIACSVLLTGLNLYPKITKFGGAGALVPITGFANSVVAPAVEFKSEGFIFGIGCKIFTIAGPVILYGILSSWILGIIVYGLHSIGVIQMF